MRVNIISFFLILVFKNIYGSFDNDSVELGLGDLTRVGTNLSADSGNSQKIAKETGIREDVITKVHDLLSNDYERNVEDLLWTRLVFRKVANISEVLGNSLSSIGVGATTLAAGTHLIKADYLSDILLFTGAACFAVHLTFIGIAKCSAREEEEREGHLKALAKEVRFNIVPLIPTVEDDVNAQRS